MRKLSIGVIVAAMAATVTLVAAGPYYRHERGAERHEREAALPPERIVSAVQSFGLVPTTRAERRGPFYVLHALDRRGTELRVVADAAWGDIVSVTPLYAPRYDAGPRIIHVPQPGDYERDSAAVPDESYREPPRRRAAPPPPRKRVRQITSAPPSPPSADDKLTPLYPTPKYKDAIKPREESARDGGREAEADNRDDADAAEKFGRENDNSDAREEDRYGAPQADRSRLPPPGFGPPPRD